MLRLLGGSSFLALLILLIVPAAGSAQDGKWGAIKGQVVFGGDAVPAPAVVNVTTDKAHCLSKGPLLGEEYVIDKGSKGVKWVMIWLTDPANPKAALPIHPTLKNPPKVVSFDQPCCAFEPHAMFVIEGQKVEAKNSATVPHNVNIQGGTLNPNLNQIIPAGKTLEVEGWKATTTPVPISCTVHPWMNMKIRVVNHPYFAVTDDKGNYEIKNAPAGKWNLVTWHEGQGYGAGGKPGVPVEVVAEKTTDLGVSNVK